MYDTDEHHDDLCATRAPCKEPIACAQCGEGCLEGEIYPIGDQLWCDQCAAIGERLVGEVRYMLRYSKAHIDWDAFGALLAAYGEQSDRETAYRVQIEVKP